MYVLPPPVNGEEGSVDELLSFQQHAHCLLVLFRHKVPSSEVPFPFPRLRRQDMAAVGMGALDLSCSCYAKSLFCATLRFHLGHSIIPLVVLLPALVRLSSCVLEQRS